MSTFADSAFADSAFAAGLSSTYAARLAAETIQKSSSQAKRTARSRRQMEEFEAQAREDGFVDADGYFTQTDEEFMAETGLAFQATNFGA